MRVVLTHTDLPLYWKPRIRRLSEFLNRAGASLTVLQVAQSGTVYDFTGELDSKLEGVDWIHLLDKNERLCDLPPRKVAKATWDHLEDLQPDVVLACAIAFTPGAVAVRWCRQRRRAVVIMDDARQQDVPRPWIVNHMKRRFYRNVDGVFIPAPSHVPSYIQWGVPRERIFLGLDVVDNDFFAARSEAAKGHLEELRTHHGLPKQFILGVGRQVVSKNWPSLITAYEQYLRVSNGEPWDLVLVGDGPDHPMLEQMVTQKGIKGIHFMPFMRPEKLCELYAMAECFVLPSVGETWGLVVNEAMACSLPVLVSNQCGCSESLVREGENGWTFPPERPSEIREAILRMSTLSDCERQIMARKSRAIVEDWSLDRFARSMMAAIESSRKDPIGFHSLTDRFAIRHWNGRYRSF